MFIEELDKTRRPAPMCAVCVAEKVKRRLIVVTHKGALLEVECVEKFAVLHTACQLDESWPATTHIAREAKRVQVVDRLLPARS